MLRLFSLHSPYRKLAKYIAVLWTLVILIACFAPSKDIPKVDVPLIDKWTHMFLFGVFSVLWLCAYPTVKWQRSAIMLLVCIIYGSAIEVVQGLLSFLGRACELMDAVADTIGGIIGIAIYKVLSGIANKTVDTGHKYIN